MAANKYLRTPGELKAKASLFWPAELVQQEASASIIPLLIETQEKFISLLDISDASPEAWKSALNATTELKANLFLKHLMVLSDLGGEPLKRLRPELKNIFPEGDMIFSWHGQTYSYRFKSILNSRSLDNKSLFVDGKSLTRGHNLNDKIEDVIMLLLHGAACLNEAVPGVIKEKCVVGSLMGEKEELERFVKQRYIWVSRITGGATSNALGQIAQQHIKETLQQALPGWTISSNGKIPGISHNLGRTNTNFDIVAKSPKGHYTAIEITFQFTTNSVIERKSGQAEARANLLHENGHNIAYMIDGAGNFEREAALTTICQFSDCMVAFSPSEIELLIEFLRSLEQPELKD